MYRDKAVRVNRIRLLSRGRRYAGTNCAEIAALKIKVLPIPDVRVRAGADGTKPVSIASAP